MVFKWEREYAPIQLDYSSHSVITPNSSKTIETRESGEKLVLHCTFLAACHRPPIISELNYLLGQMDLDLYPFLR